MIFYVPDFQDPRLLLPIFSYRCVHQHFREKILHVTRCVARIMNKDVHMSIRVSNKSNSLNLFDKLLARCDSNQR